MLPASVADQTLQAIARRNPEVLDILRRMDQLELPQGRPLHHPVNALDVLLMPDALGVLAAERSDHETSAERTPSLTLDVEPKLHHVPTRRAVSFRSGIGPHRHLVAPAQEDRGWRRNFLLETAFTTALVVFDDD